MRSIRTAIPVTRLVVIAYDIPSDRRRRRLARVADDFGARLQKSVFFAWLTPAGVQRLRARIDQLILPGEDSVAIFCACETCRRQTITRGLARLPSLPRYWII